MGASLRVLQECSDGLVCTLGRCTSWQHTAREIWADRVWYTDTRAKVTDLLHAGRVWPPPHVSVAIRDLLFVVANSDYRPTAPHHGCATGNSAWDAKKVSAGLTTQFGG